MTKDEVPADRRRAAGGAASTSRRVQAAALLVALAGAPVILASLLGFDAIVTPWMLGSVVGLVSSLMSARLGLTLAAVAGSASVVGALVSPYPVLGGLFMGLLAGAAGLTARRGVHSPVLMVPMVVGFSVADPFIVRPADGGLVNALLGGAVLALGTLWAVAVWVLLASRVPKVPPSPFSAGIAKAYAAVMAGVLGIATWAVLAWAPGHTGAWLLMTLIVVMQPDPHATLARSLARMTGTVLGVLMAAVIASVVSAPTVLLVVGLVLLFVALVLRFDQQRPYWVYVSFLTPAVVFFDSGTGGIAATEASRLGATLLGGAIAVVMALLARTIVDRQAVP